MGPWEDLEECDTVKTEPLKYHQGESIRMSQVMERQRSRHGGNLWRLGMQYKQLNERQSSI